MANLFNSPLEVGLRILFLIKNTTKSALDKQRLIYYNYLLVHSSDVPNSPPSLHPPLPHRACEIQISGELITKGLNLLLAKDIICVSYQKSGIKYKPNKITNEFAEHFNSNYSKDLNQRAQWVCNTFDEYSENRLTEFIQSNSGKWGSEFSNDYHPIGDLNE